MTSKALFVITACLAGTPCVSKAELACSALISNYHRLNVRDRPSGVHEWSAEGLLFVHARVPYSGSETPEMMEAAELRSVRKSLFEWAVVQGGKEVPDPPLPQGLDFVRRIVRDTWPTWGRESSWRFAGDTCAFTEEAKNERLYTMVCRKADVLASIPDDFRRPVTTDEWLRGLQELVTDVYATRGDLAFMWRIGALDALDVSRETKAAFPSFASNDFKAEQATFLNRARDTWRGVDSPAKTEYAAFRARLATYLAESPAACGFLRDARAAIAPHDKTEWRSFPVETLVTTNVVTAVVTNPVSEVVLRTNETVVAVAEAGTVPVMVAGDCVSRRSVSAVAQEVVVTETVTTVRTTRTARERTVLSDTGDPVFERLFLAGGCIGGQARSRTPRGDAAERAFFAVMTSAERRATILDALRENPGDKGLWNLFGRCLKTEGDAMGAVVCFRNALRIDRTYVFALTNLAETYRELGCPVSARACAVLARGLAEDAWCRTHAEAVLSDGEQ